MSNFFILGATIRKCNKLSTVLEN